MALALLYQSLPLLRGRLWLCLQNTLWNFGHGDKLLGRYSNKTSLIIKQFKGFVGKILSQNTLAAGKALALPAKYTLDNLFLGEEIKKER